MSRILVVEDNADIRGLVVRRLERAGHRVLGAAEAVEAATLITDKGAPDLVVLDVNMPGVNGFDLLQLLRDQIGRTDLPAIFLSGRMHPDDVARGQSMGAIYLTKPFVSSALLAAIETVLAGEAAASGPQAAGAW